MQKLYLDKWLHSMENSRRVKKRAKTYPQAFTQYYILLFLLALIRNTTEETHTSVAIFM